MTHSAKFLVALVMATVAAEVACGGGNTPFADGSGTDASMSSGSSSGGGVSSSDASSGSPSSGATSGGASSGGTASTGAPFDAGAIGSDATGSGSSGTVATDGGSGTPADAAAPQDGDARPTEAGSVGVDSATGSQRLSIWIAGDSTVATHNPASATSVESWGWGGQFGPFFNSFVTVNDDAVAGRSVRTWLYNVLAAKDATGECALTLDASGSPVLQPRWTAMLASMKAGDYLFIQFGINDGDPTCPRHVGSAAFEAAYGLMAKAAQALGAHPIFVTPVNGLNACNWVSNRGFLTETKAAGMQYGVPVVDLNALSIAYFKSIGCTATTAIFADGRTHFTQAGASAIARLVAQGLRDVASPLSAYLK